MGVTNIKPKQQMVLESAIEKSFNFVSGSSCGSQYFQEDRWGWVQVSEQVKVLYVIDGHGGPQVAQFCCEEIPKVLKNFCSEEWKDVKTVLQSLIVILDARLEEGVKRLGQIRKEHHLNPIKDGSRAGCSLAIVACTQNEVVVGNIGECKTYVCYRYSPTKAVLLGGNDEAELQRVFYAGGVFFNGNVDGIYPFTNCIGHLQAKKTKILSNCLSLVTLDKTHIKMLVLGSGGLWPHHQFVLQQTMSEDLELNELKEKVKQLFQYLIQKHSQSLQNMTLCAIQFKN